MKRTISVIMALALAVSCVFALAGCSKETASYDVVLITDGASINDGGYNENTWNGVKSYADDNQLSCRYYQPYLNDNDELDADIIAKYVDLAIKDGAKTVVMPGADFAQALCDIAKANQDINFILAGSELACDDTDHTNVATVTFDALQAGYLAGYSAVALGNTRLGYFGAVNTESAEYGAGYVQGAAMAADESATPVVLDYANFDDKDLTYDYSFTIKAVYNKVSDCKEKVYKVNVVDGLGTGVYTDGHNVTITANAPEANKIFDHWEVKSDTEGISDKKVNISSSKKESMNLLVGDCDCTITAVYADSETVPVTVKGGDTINAQKDSKIWVTAPAAESGKVFDHWECDTEDAVVDVNSKGTDVNVGTSPVHMTPVYVDSEYPTFDITVIDGTGTGSYATWDDITCTSNPPEDGYMFYKWENVDNQGKLAGIAMDNEYDYSTSFQMVDRFASVVEEMIDNGTQVIFAGGNPVADAIFTANSNFDYPVYGFGAGYDQKSSNNCLASVVNDYGAAVKLLLADFKAGNMVGTCANGCIYVTGMSINETWTDDEGNEQKDENYNAGYAKLYKSLSDGKLKPAAPAKNPEKLVKSKCLTVNYWVK